jgi:hypothetical protein
MAGAVSKVAGNGQEGNEDGEGDEARFNGPSAVVVDKMGTIVVAETDNNRLCRMTGRHVTTLAGRARRKGTGPARAPSSPGGWR